jgi:protein-tyrosine phosphatase
VHCEGGYSRSCGVVLALHNIYGFAVNLNSLSQANRSVVATMDVNKR